MARRRYITTLAGSDKDLSSVSERASNCYLLSVPHADCCGRLTGDPFEYVCTVIAGRRYTDEVGEDILRELVERGLYVRYEVNGQVVVSFPAHAFIKHQSRALNEASRAEHPEPPAGLEGLLREGYNLAEEARKYGVSLSPPRKSAKERGKAPKNAAPPSPSPPPSPSLSPPPSERPAQDKPAPAPVRCGWCENPKPETAPPTQVLLQSYHDLFREIHHNCPTMVPGKDGKALAAVLNGKTVERIRAVIAHGLRSQDRFLLNKGFSLGAILSNFDGIAMALDAGKEHGRREVLPSQGGPRRQPPAPASAFTQTGVVKL